MEDVNPICFVGPEEKLGGEALEEGEYPSSLREAMSIILSFAGKEAVGKAAGSPNASDHLWRYVSSHLGVFDGNRKLLIDCIARNRFTRKPRGIDMAAWVAVMSAAEEVFGSEKTAPYKYKD